MSKIPTAEELLKDKTQFGTYGDMYKREDVSKKMIEFAKLHVEAIKKQFKIVINEIDDTFPFERKDILKDIYPLKNIK